MVKFLIMLTTLFLSSYADLSKPLNLNEYWGVSRSQDFVSGGIPLPKSLITDARQVGVFNDQGAQVPLQTRDLMKWPDGSLRWVLLTFPADAAGQSSTKYQLRLSQAPSFTSPANPAGQVTVAETANDVTVSTGKLTFTIRKSGTGFNLFDRVLIAKDPDGVVDDEIVSPSLQNGAIIWDKFDSAYTSGNDMTYKVKVEESGPLCTIIKITGNHSNGSTDPRFYGYICRIYAYAGKSYVKVQYSVKNSYYIARGPLAMNGMQIRLKGNLSGSQTATLYGSSLVSAPLVDSAYVYQFRQNSFWAKSGAVTADSGSRALGWVDASDGNWGIALGDYEFASNCPNEMHVKAGGEFEARFFPKRYAQGSAVDSTSYQQTDRFFIGLGEHKTHRFCIYFHSGSAAQANVANVMGAFNHPLLPQMDKEWIALTRAVPGEISPAAPPVLDPALFKLPLINAPLSSPQYVGAGGTGTRGYYDSWCSFGEAFWRNETGDTELMENQGTRYFRWLSPYILRLFESNAWLYADFRGCHIDSAVCYNPPTYYSLWWANGAKDPVHSAGLPSLHRWIIPNLGTHVEHFTARDLFTYYLVSGDFQIRDGLYEFAQMANYVLTWPASAASQPMQGGMDRAHGSSWLSLQMASLVENKDTIAGKTPQNYFTGLVTDWTNGRTGKVGIFASLTPVGCWKPFWLKESATDSVYGPHNFMEAICDMGLAWYVENHWSDTLKSYIDRRVTAWRDTVIGDNGGLAYHGFKPTGTADNPAATSNSNWRIPGPLALLYFFSGDTGLIRKTNLFCMDGGNAKLFAQGIDENYYDKDDITFSQAYLLYLNHKNLFLQNPIITWASDPTAAEFAPPAAALSPIRIFPNPARSRTLIVFNGGKLAPRGGDLKVRIFDIRGREVALLKGGFAASAVVWETSRLSSGVYWVNVTVAGKRYNQKVIIAK